MDARAYDDRLYVYIAEVRIVSEHQKKNFACFLPRSLSLSFMHPLVPDKRALCPLTCKINA